MEQNLYQIEENQSQTMQAVQVDDRVKMFQILAKPSILYALCFTVLLYDNFSSITMPLFVIATLLYYRYCRKVFHIPLKKNSWIYETVMMCLAVSDVWTANGFVIFFNNVGMILMFLCMLLHNGYDDKKWTLGKYFGAVVTSVFCSVGCVSDLCKDAGKYIRETRGKKTRGWIYVLIGIGIAIPLLLMILTLLYFADAVFASFLNKGFEFDLNLGTGIGITVMFLFAFTAAYCGMRFLQKHKIAENVKIHKSLEPIVAITVLTLISVVYLFFSGIQIVYLFIGKLELPGGYSYATYAREGFFQLLAVCFINVAMVLFVEAFFRENRVLKTELTIISICTYVMIASSIMRMLLYIKNYNLTFLRILVLWSLGMIGVLLFGIMLQIYRADFPLFRYMLIVTCVGYLAFSFARPDYIIAKFNLSRIEEISESDQENAWHYLSNLSADAAPALADCEGNWVENYGIHMEREKEESWRKFNVSRFYAAHLLENK